MKTEIIVVTGAYGADTNQTTGRPARAVAHHRRRGRRRGGDPPRTVRRRRTGQPACAGPEIERQQLFAVYSAPEALFTPQHTLNPNLPTLLAEAQALNARQLKLSLGHFRPGFDFTELKVALEQHPVKLVVENDQTPDCGILSMLNAFFHAAEDSHLPVSMTFDMANWLWVGQDAFAAAERWPATSVTCTSRPRRKARAAGAPLRWTIPTAAGAICWPACRTRRRAASNSRCRVMTEAVTRHYVNILRAE